MRRNWIADMNRFGLEAPPTWWLQGLHDFDSQLVVIPSRQQALYRIARRRQFSPGIGALAVLDTNKDTAMLAHYGLVPVTTMIRFGGAWDIAAIVQKLRDRDMWQITGGPMSGKSAAERAGMVADKLEAQEAADEQQTRERTRADLDYRSRDAFRSYQARTGQRTRMTSPSPGKQSPSSGTTQAAIGNRVVLASA